MTSTDLATADQVVDLVRRAMIDVDERVARAVAGALRLYARRPPETRGTPTVGYGQVVSSAGNGFTDVLLDGADISIPVPSIGAFTAGARVAVLFLPPSSALCLGGGGGGSGGGGSTAWPSIGALLAAAALTGTELVPIDQGGNTVHTTTGAIAALAGVGGLPAPTAIDQVLTVISLAPLTLGWIDRATLVDGVVLLESGMIVPVVTLQAEDGTDLQAEDGTTIDLE